MATPARIRANQKYDQKAYDKIIVRIHKDRLDDSGLSRESIQKAAEDAGMSVNGFILQAVAEKMNK